MNFNQLAYFQIIAGCENLTQASEQLCVSQPALSKLIRNLEGEFGVQFFDHKGRNIILNENGRIFLKHANDILDSIASLKRQLQDQGRERELTLSVGLFVGSALFPDIMAGFRREHPDITINMIQHKYENGGQPSDMDIIVCAGSDGEEWENVHRTVLSEEEILLAVPPDHPLAGRDSVALADLANEKFILLSKGKSLRNICDRMFEQEQIHPAVLLETDDPAMLRKLIDSGFGISFVPEKTWTRNMSGHMRLLRISKPVCSRQICMYVSEKIYQKSASRLFQQHLIAYFREMA